MSVEKQQLEIELQYLNKQIGHDKFADEMLQLGVEGFDPRPYRTLAEESSLIGITPQEMVATAQVVLATVQETFTGFAQQVVPTIESSLFPHSLRSIPVESQNNEQE
jgi:hypothetical protein